MEGFYICLYGVCMCVCLIQRIACRNHSLLCCVVPKDQMEVILLAKAPFATETSHWSKYVFKTTFI